MPRLRAASIAFLAVLGDRGCAPEPEQGPRSIPSFCRRRSQQVAFRVPDESEIRDPSVLASVRRGKALLAFTRDSLPQHVGNRLQCVSCHPDNGTRSNVMPWVGVYARFPQYRARVGGIQVIEDRINDCFKRSMNGKPLVPESRDMRDMIAYMAFLSSGYPGVRAGRRPELPEGSGAGRRHGAWRNDVHREVQPSVTA